MRVFSSLGLLPLLGSVRAVTVTASSTTTTAASPLQYGLMFEDINHSGDGGIYAELIQNRAFQGDQFTAATLQPWTALGGATLALQKASPALSSALPNSVNVKGNANQVIGISNGGFWGIEVKPQTYTGTFWVLGAYTGSFTASLVGSSGTVLATTKITSYSKAGSWTQQNFTLTPTSAASNTKNTFQLAFTPTSSSQSLNFGFVSLFPPTYNNRPNGLRVDLMNALKNLNPSFLRLPGGNNLEGNAPGNAWNWTNTVGPLINRPGRTGTWSYYNTDGLGLIEYMEWCQDLDMEPVLAFPSGLYLNGDVVSQANLQPFVAAAMNELEFLMGDSSTTYGAKRIALGYAKPFPIKYVEIGNEDNLSSGQSSYDSYRYSMFYNAISAKYPSIQVISSTTALTPQPGNTAGDYHDYATPDTFVQAFTQFNGASTTHKVLAGEYAAVQANLAKNTGTNWDLPLEPYPWWVGAISEAVYAIGAERNSNKMIGVSYAPLLQNLNSIQWHPDLISFNADSSQTVLSVSYQQIKFLSNNRITGLLADSSSSAFGPAYWVTGINAADYLFKVAVYNTSSSVPFTVSFPGIASGATAQLTILTAPSGPYAMNMPGGANIVNTTVSTVAATDSGFSFSLPEWSIAVLSTPKPGSSASDNSPKPLNALGTITKAASPTPTAGLGSRAVPNTVNAEA